MKNKFLRTQIIFWFMVALLLGNGSGSACADITTGLVAWWKMEEATGVNLTDSSGNGYTGTATGSPVSTLPCPRGKCLNFNGTSQSVNIPGNIAALDNASAFTISAWANFTGQKASTWAGTIISKISAWNTTKDLLFGLIGGLLLFQINKGVDGSGYFSFSSYGQWVLLTSVFDGTQTGNAGRMKIYLNGVNQTLMFDYTVPAVSESMSGYPQNIGIYLTDYGTSMYGYIDDVRIYNRALSEADVRELYRSSVISRAHLGTAVIR